MKKSLLVLMLLIISNFCYAGFFGLFDSENFHECILDNMPGEKSFGKTREIYEQCLIKHPNPEPIKKKHSFFGVQSMSECLEKYAKDENQAGIAWIKVSCYKLYSTN